MLSKWSRIPSTHSTSSKSPLQLSLKPNRWFPWPAVPGKTTSLGGAVRADTTAKPRMIVSMVLFSSHLAAKRRSSGGGGRKPICPTCNQRPKGCLRCLENHSLARGPIISPESNSTGSWKTKRASTWKGKGHKIPKSACRIACSMSGEQQKA